jgi:hypothetical protein
MQLEGSCHCGAVRFRLESRHPYPFNLCYCSICRKTAGSGGFAINLSGDNETLEVEGREHLRIYQATVQRPGQEAPHQSPGMRHFCGQCGTPLWLWDPRWPELVHPLASAIDTQLPVPPERTHLLLDSPTRASLSGTSASVWSTSARAMNEGPLVLEQLNRLVREMDVTLAFYRLLGLVIPEDAGRPPPTAQETATAAGGVA